MSDDTKPIPYASTDPEKRARQLANLPNLRGEATAGSFASPATPHMSHGLRTRNPPAIVLDPIVQELEDALAVDLPVQADDGGVPGVDRFALSLAALAILRVRRGWTYLLAVEDGGAAAPPSFDDQLRKAEEHAARMLDRLGMSPRARASLGLDLARAITAGDAVAAHVARQYGGDRS